MTQEEILAFLPKPAEQEGQATLVNENEPPPQAEGSGVPPAKYGLSPEQLQSFLKPKSQEDEVTYLPPETWGGEAAFGIKRGVEQLKQTVSGIGALGSRAIGATGMADYFQKAYNDQEEAIQKYPATVPTYEGVDSGDKFARYLISGGSEFLPQLGEMFATGAAGAALGTAVEPGGGTIAGGVAGFVERQAVKNLLRSELIDVAEKKVLSTAAKRGALGALEGPIKNSLVTETKNLFQKWGANAAIGANSWIMETASIYNDAPEGADEGTRRWSSILGGFVAALPDTAFQGYIASKFFPGEKHVTKEMIDDASSYIQRFFKKAAVTAPEAILGEGGQEFGQTGIELAAKHYMDPKRKEGIFDYSKEEFKSMIDAGFKGMIGGGMVAGPVAAFEALPAHPSPAVNKHEGSLQEKIKDVAPPPPVQDEEAPSKADERLSEIQNRQAEIDSKLDDETISTEEKATLRQEHAQITAEESKILEEMGNEKGSLVNETEKTDETEATVDPWANIPDYIVSNMKPLAEMAEKNGVADKIEEAAAQEKTKAQIAKELNVDPDIVQAVRIQRGIPSMNMGGPMGHGPTGVSQEFLDWKTKREAKKAATQPPAKKSAFQQASDFITEKFKKIIPTQKARLGVQPATKEQMGKTEAEINSLVTETSAGADPQVAKEFTDAVQKGLTPETRNMLATEGVATRMPTPAERKTKFKGEDGFGVFIDENDNIVLGVPSAEGFNKSQTSHRAVFEAKQAGKPVQTTQNMNKVIEHEVIHVADLVQLRREWKQSGSEQTFAQYEREKMNERGKMIREAMEASAKLTNMVYNFGEAVKNFTDRTLGQEFPRMIVEWARTGELSEVTDALWQLSLQEQTKGEKGNMTKTFEKWIKAIRDIFDALSVYLTDGTFENNAIKEAYVGINKVLDEYSLVNENRDEDSMKGPPKKKKPSARKKAMVVDEPKFGPQQKVGELNKGMNKDLNKGLVPKVNEGLNKDMNKDLSKRPYVPTEPRPKKAKKEKAPEPEPAAAAAQEAPVEEKYEPAEVTVGGLAVTPPPGQQPPESTGTGPRVISTAFQREGRIYVGNTWKDNHVMIAAIAHEGKLEDPTQSERGFIVEDENGVRTFVGREEGGRAAAKARQAKEGADLKSFQSESLVEQQPLPEPPKVEEPPKQEEPPKEKRKTLENPVDSIKAYIAEQNAKGEEVSKADFEIKNNAKVSVKVWNATIKQEREQAAVNTAQTVTKEITTTLTPTERKEAAQELGFKSWTKAAAAAFEKSLADWLITGKAISDKLIKTFEKVMAAGKNITLMIVVALNNQFAPEFKPPIQQSEFNPSEPVSAEIQTAEPPAVSFPRLPEFRPDMEPRMPSISTAIPGSFNPDVTGLNPVGVPIAPDRPTQADFVGTNPSREVRNTANWIVKTGDNDGYSFMVADKINGELYVFNSDGGLIGVSPALFGKDRGDTFKGEAKITPAGRFKGRTSIDPEGLLGRTVDFATTPDKSSVAIHRTYLSTDPQERKEERRLERMATPSPLDNRISWGCVNAPDAFMDDVILPAVEDTSGAIVYVLPETKEGQRKVSLTREPMPEDEGAARAATPGLSKSERAKVDTKAYRLAEQMVMISNDMPIAEVKTRLVAGDVAYADSDPLMLSYETRPRTLGQQDAANAILRNGGALAVGERLMTEPLGEFLGLKADTVGYNVGPNANLGYVYDQVGLSLYAISGNLKRNDGSKKGVAYIRGIADVIKARIMATRNTAGALNDSSTRVMEMMDGAQAKSHYSALKLSHLDKVYGAEARQDVAKLANDLNDSLVKAAPGVVKSSAFIKKVRKLWQKMQKVKYQKGYRKSILANVKALYEVTKQAAARMAQYAGLDKDSRAYTDAFITRLVNEASGLPKHLQSQTETDYVLESIARVYRETGKAMGKITPDPKRENVSIHEKMAAILKNEEMYRELALDLREGYIKKWGGINPSSTFLAEVDEMYARISNRMYDTESLTSLVNEKMRDYGTTFAKIARQSYKDGELVIEDMTKEIRKFLKDQGIENDALVEQLVNDVNDQMEARVEKGRRSFFGSAKTIQEALRNAQISMVDAVTDYSADPDKLEQAFYSFLTNPQYGFDESTALEFTDLMMTQAQPLIANKNAALIQQWLDRAEKKVQAEKGTTALQQQNKMSKLKSGMDKVLGLAKAGIMEQEDIYNVLQPLFDLPKWDENVANQIRELGNKMEAANHPRQKDAIKQELAHLLSMHKPVKTSDVYISWMYFSMLSGPGTLGINIGGNMSGLGAYLMTEAIKRPTKLPTMIRAMLRAAIGSGWAEFRESWFHGTALGKDGNKYFKGRNIAEMEDVFLEADHSLAKADIALAKFTHTMLKGAKFLRPMYVGRFLTATDMWFYKIAQEMSFSLSGGPEGTPQMWSSALEAARNEMVAQGVNPDENAASRARRDTLANSIYNEKRRNSDPSLVNENHERWIESHKAALKATFQQDPTGILGDFAKMVERFTNDHPTAKLLVPFTRVAANVANFMLDFTPVGMGRFLLGNIKDDSFDFSSMEAFKNNKYADEAIRSVLGMMSVMGIMLMAGMAHDDDPEDPAFAVYGDGPKDPDKRKLWMDKGGKKNTIKIGSLIVNYNYWPMAMMFALAGKMWDDYRDGKTPSPNDISLPTMAVAFLESVKNQSFLVTATDFFGAVDSANPERNLSRIAARIMTIPLPNLFKQTDRWINPSVQQAQSLYEYFIKEIPIWRNELEPGINYFGQEIERTRGAVPIIGVDRFATFEKTDDEVLNLVSEKNLDLPGYSQSTRINGEPIGKRYGEYVKLAGPEIYKRIKANIPTLRRMTTSEANDWIENVATEEKRKAKKELEAKYKK